MANTCSTSRRRLAFTIIELLVVIAIIALLAALLIPSFTLARKQARRLACGVNLRAVGNAVMLYKTEYGQLPLRSLGPVPENFLNLTNMQGSIVKTLIKLSLDGPEPFYCPTSLANDIRARPPYRWVPHTSARIHHWETGDTSYIYLPGVMHPFLDEDGTPTFIPELEAPHLAKRSRTVLLGDRTIEFHEKHGYVPASNHGKEGGWFYFSDGGGEWHDWHRLAAHPAPKTYIWYWPRTAKHPP